MAIHVQWNDPIWESLPREFQAYPTNRTDNGCLSNADRDWLISDDVPGHYSWFVAGSRLIGFSDPGAAMMFRLRCG